MSATSLYFVAPGEVELRERPVPEPESGEVLIKAEISAISAGTEQLVYRGEAPESVDTDETVPAFVDGFSYPMRYGYATVGQVIETGAGVAEKWLGQRVFAYNPHESHFLAEPNELVSVPDTLSSRHAALLATAETAVTFLLDGQPALGERVAVFGQGVVGLLTTGLLAETPLERLVAVEPLPERRELARGFGADLSVSPENLAELYDSRPDITYELSGDPRALDDAMGVTGFDGRIIVGSWYGTKPATVSFGGRFHRHRLDITSSQVSTIASRYTGRWSRQRRHDVAWSWLDRLPVERLITHELPITEASRAYERLEASPDEVVQVLFTY